MKGLFKTAVAAAVVLGVVAQPHAHGHGHGHSHLHSKKHAHGIEKRGDKVIVTEVVEGPTVVVYVDGDGKKVESAEAEKGIKKGEFYILGSTKPSFSAPPPVSSTSLASPDHGGQFFEKTSSSSSSTPTSSSTPPPPPPSSTKPVEEALPTGIDADFPSGKVPCGKLPTQYGAVPVPGTGTDGWATLANMGSWIKGVSFNNFQTAISGGCKPGMMCSYACPPGHEKTQWPEEQGETGQSVGGLWCNSKGMLELTRPNATRICAPGAGGVFVRNELPKNAAICRTDYPGNEAMVIPLNTQPGSTYPLTNPDSKTSYWWKGAPTTAQYYVNNAGVEVEEACTWQSPKFPDSAGNWAPINIGVGLSLGGETFISIFPNLPTSTAILDFSIEIIGDISGTCWFRNGEYYGSDKGCTVGMQRGGKATIVLSP